MTIPLSVQAGLWSQLSGSEVLISAPSFKLMDEA